MPLPPSRATLASMITTLKELFRVMLVAMAMAACTPALRAQPAPLPYTTQWVGLEGHADLKPLLEEVSSLHTLETAGPVSTAGLQVRADQDQGTLLAALRSEGYFAATVTITVGQALDQSTVPVALHIQPGPRYVIETLALKASPDSPDDPALILQNAVLGLAPGAPARGPDILALQGRLPGLLAGAGYPLASALPPQMVVDHRTRVARITLPVNTGPKASLGRLTVKGLDAVDGRLIANRIPWQPGTVYAPAQLDRFRTQLGKLDVFQTTRTTTASAVEPDGSLPVDLTVTEKPPRFIGGGISYGLSEGLTTNAYWGHRNYFGGAERLRLDGEIGRVGAQDGQGEDAELSLSFTKPDVLAPLQTLKTSLSAKQEQPEAYQQRALTANLGFEREISPILTLGYGTALEYSDTSDGTEADQQFYSWGFPLTLKRVTSDNPLEPTQGTKLALELTPYVATGDKTSGFVRAQIGGSLYVPFWDEQRPHILGLRGSYGMLFGARASEVPADKRFYAGGAGSVRGYGNQLIGPTDSSGTPIGGRNMITAGADLRLRVAENWGLVPFVDAGTVVRSSEPNLSADVQIGAGLGVLYFTPIGPVRADLAVPVNPRANDDDFQFYISLGQPF